MGNNSGKERHGSLGTTVEPYETPPTSPYTLTSTTWSPTTQLVSFSNSLSRAGTNTTTSELAQEALSPSLISTIQNELLGECRTGPTNHVQEEVLKLTQVPGQIPQFSIVDATEIDAKLLQECLITLGLNNIEESTYTLNDLLQCFLEEREKMKEELRSCKEKIQAEREEWKQFQADLKVALVVSDRLRAEAEEELSVLSTARQDWDRQLTDALLGQRELEGQLESLKAELEQSRQKTKLVTGNHQEAPSLRGLETGGDMGRAERYGKSITPAEKSREEQLWKDETKGKKETNISSSTERSSPQSVSKTVTLHYITWIIPSFCRSLNRLPSDCPAVVVNGTSQHSVTTDSGKTQSLSGSLNQQSSTTRSIKADNKEDNSILQTATSSVLDVPNKSNRTRAHEDFSSGLRLLRVHGGSKRNSLLRWCQGRTHGYKNIEITNFSSSWVDGLAFCAIYHSYLPSHIPFNTLSPENKKDNLALAFRTGESCGISASLTVEEMLKDDAPDWHRVLEYVESIYRHFEM